VAATDQTAPSGANQTQAEPAPAQSSTDATPEAKSTTIRGCLEAGADHGYTVTDKNGIRYTLISTDVNALSSHVGEEVEADGEPAPGSDASTGAGPATDKPAGTPSQTFKVNDVRKVSDRCAM
jgi:hypothetical protein